MDSQVGKVGEEVGFYLFNDEANGRFVIVSGDERQTDILGYSDEGYLDLNDMPDNLPDDMPFGYPPPPGEPVF